jgi:hypothetical protein
LIYTIRRTHRGSGRKTSNLTRSEIYYGRTWGTTLGPPLRHSQRRATKVLDLGVTCVTDETGGFVGLHTPTVRRNHLDAGRVAGAGGSKPVEVDGCQLITAAIEDPFHPPHTLAGVAPFLREAVPSAETADNRQGSLIWTPGTVSSALIRRPNVD